jgi:hypothetical protein
MESFALRLRTPTERLKSAVTSTLLAAHEIGVILLEVKQYARATKTHYSERLSELRTKLWLPSERYARDFVVLATVLTREEVLRLCQLYPAGMTIERVVRVCRKGTHRRLFNKPEQHDHDQVHDDEADGVHDSESELESLSTTTTNVELPVIDNTVALSAPPQAADVPTPVISSKLESHCHWFTPLWLVAMFRDVFAVTNAVGDGYDCDFDPCTEPAALRFVRSKHHQFRDGLSVPWIGRSIIMNAPFSEAKLWADKLQGEHRRRGKELHSISVWPLYGVPPQWLTELASAGCFALLSTAVEFVEESTRAALRIQVTGASAGAFRYGVIIVLISSSRKAQQVFKRSFRSCALVG